MFELEVVGSRGGCPQWDNPCSGYVLRTAQTRLLLECGPGVAGTAWPALRDGELDAIVISHMHGDHFMDLIPLTYGFLGEHALADRPQKQPALWLPPGGREVLRSVAHAFGFAEIQQQLDPSASGIPLLERYFAVQEYAPAVLFRVSDISLLPARVPHTIDAYALRAETAEATLVYSGDTSGGPALVDVARNCDVLLCEASAVRRGPALPPGHMSAIEAAHVASEARVGHLVLTHLIEFAASKQALLLEASAGFSGRIDVALPERRFAITPPPKASA